MASDRSELKRAAAEAAAMEVESGMVVGLGTGSTIAFFLDALGRRLRDGEIRDVRGVPTSVRTTDAARRLEIPLTTLEDEPVLDLAVDGADEVDPAFDLIKGLGGALLREKVVAQATERLLIIVDEGKLVERLGSRSPLPVEVVPYAEAPVRRFAEGIGAVVVRRETDDGNPYRTDNGNHVLDCRMPDGIADPQDLERRLRKRAGVVETGLFLGLTDTVFVGGRDGVRSLHRGDPRTRVGAGRPGTGGPGMDVGTAAP